MAAENTTLAPAVANTTPAPAPAAVSTNAAPLEPHKEGFGKKFWCAKCQAKGHKTGVCPFPRAHPRSHYKPDISLNSRPDGAFTLSVRNGRISKPHSKQKSQDKKAAKQHAPLAMRTKEEAETKKETKKGKKKERKEQEEVKAQEKDENAMEIQEIKTVQVTDASGSGKQVVMQMTGDELERVQKVLAEMRG